ncbi:MAG: sodium-dependent transporter [Gemmatimonadales bacterium]
MTRENWGSRFGFLMATVGFSIGLGTIWRFPYLLGQNGGGAFLAVYLVLAVFIGIPLFTAEISLGRKTQLTPIAGMRKLAGGRKSLWTLIGWLGVLAAFMIMSYYQLLMGWIVAYFVKTVAGRFAGASPGEIQQAFTSFVSDPGPVLLYTAFVVLIHGLIVTRGVQGGLEKANKWMLPLLWILLVLLAAGSLTLPGAMAGVRWYLWPDPSKVTAAAVLAALGQAFLSIGVGMAAAFVYGSYMDPADSDVPGGATIVVAALTITAVIAGLAIFPALFAFGLEPNGGPGLVFVTMSNLFARIPAGPLVGGVFFFLVFLAGLTSGIALLEALAASLMDSLGLSRRLTVWGSLALIFLAGIPSALAFGPWSGVRLFGRNIFELVDFVSGNILLSAGGLLIALYTVAVWGFDAFQRETNVGARRVRVFRSWKPLVTLVVPAAVVLVLLRGLGIL